MPISKNALILGGAGQWNMKSGSVSISLSVYDTSEGASFSLSLVDFDTDPGEDENGNENLSPFLNLSLDHDEFRRLAEFFDRAGAAMQAVAAKLPANDG